MAPGQYKSANQRLVVNGIRDQVLNVGQTRSLRCIYHSKSRDHQRGDATSTPRVTRTKFMLSERAKGKQRAVDPPVGEAESSRDLVVRFTEGAPDLTVTINKADSVKDVKKRV